MSKATRKDTQSPALHVVDGDDPIRVHGTHVSSLKDVRVGLPERRLTVFAGVSGSGKSSQIHDAVSSRHGVISVGQSAMGGLATKQPATSFEIDHLTRLREFAVHDPRPEILPSPRSEFIPVREASEQEGATQGVRHAFAFQRAG